MNTADQTEAVAELLRRLLRVTQTRIAVASACYPILRALIACLLALTFCIANPASMAYAKKDKRAKYGTITILTTPGGLPIEIDGKSEGQTTTDRREFDRDPGLHTVVITLPGGARWTREIDLQAKSIKCVVIDFSSAVQGTVEPGDVRGTICDCGDITNIPKVPWWKRAAAKLKRKK